MSFGAYPPYTPNERTGILLMCVALLAALLLISNEISSATNRAARSDQARWNAHKEARDVRR